MQQPTIGPGAVPGVVNYGYLPPEQFGRVPPQSPGLEEAVLGTCIEERGAFEEVLSILKVSDFYSDSHQRIWEAMLRLQQRGQPIDLLLLTNELRNNRELEIVGGPAYITGLSNRVTGSENLEMHARIVAQLALRREMITFAQQTISLAYNDSIDVFELMSQTGIQLAEIEAGRFSNSDPDLEKQVADTLAALKDKAVEGIESSYTDLTRIIDFYGRSELIILGARPSVGKSLFALNEALAMIDAGKRILFFSLEMSYRQVINRALSIIANVEHTKIKNKRLTPDEQERVDKAGAWLAARKHLLTIVDKTSLTSHEVAARAKRRAKRYGLDMIMIDYLQLMSPVKKTDSRNNDIGTISRDLKKLAGELSVPVLALSQLSRAADQEEPILAHLRDSGNIEQDADMVLFLHSDWRLGIRQDAEGNSTFGLLRVLVAKARSGGLGSVHLSIDGRYCRISNRKLLNSNLLPPPPAPEETPPF